MALEPNFTRDLAAGERVAIEAAELSRAEDLVVHAFLPFYIDRSSNHSATAHRELSESNWRFRPDLLRELKGRTFSGRLLDLHVEMLIPTADRFAAEIKLPRYDYDRAIALDNVVNLLFTATKSGLSGKAHGTMERSAWYTRANRGDKRYEQYEFWKRFLGPDTADTSVRRTQTSLR